MTRLLLMLVAVLAVSDFTNVNAAEPKRLLVVSTTLGFRHSSIPVGEKVVRELAERSGDFTVDFASVDPSDPKFILTEEEETALDAESDRSPRSRRRRGNPKVEAAIRDVLAEKMSPEALQNYDGVIFLNTTGTLPIPDSEAFLNWLKEGHAFIGMHAASDTFHGGDEPSAYATMLNGEFRTHGAQVSVELLNVDPAHPANAELGRSLTVFEEMYLFKNYNRSLAHSLLNMDEHPNERTAGHYPVSWCRMYGKGPVFYTSLGHREDIWDPSWADGEGKRANPPEVAVAYQKHILGGIRWALGLRPGDSTPQVTE